MKLHSFSNKFLNLIGSWVDGVAAFVGEATTFAYFRVTSDDTLQIVQV